MFDIKLKWKWRAFHFHQLFCFLLMSEDVGFQRNMVWYTLLSIITYLDFDSITSMLIRSLIHFKINQTHLAWFSLFGYHTHVKIFLWENSFYQRCRLPRNFNPQVQIFVLRRFEEMSCVYLHRCILMELFGLLKLVFYTVEFDFYYIQYQNC